MTCSNSVFGFDLSVALLFLISFSSHSFMIASVESLCVQFTPAFVSPANILSPSHSKSARERHSAETPPWAVREGLHSCLLSCSLQLLPNAPFLYLTLLFGEQQWRHHTHSFPMLPPPSPLWLPGQFSERGGGRVRCLMPTAHEDNGPLDLFTSCGKRRPSSDAEILSCHWLGVKGPCVALDRGGGEP